MMKGQHISQGLGQQSTIQTMDQQLYAVAQQVKWSKADEFPNHILRLGGFHSACCFIATIGKFWGDGGLRDLLAESGVYAPSSVDMMLAGKQFQRAVRGLTLSYEAMMQVFLMEFVKWCNEDQQSRNLNDILHQIEDTYVAQLNGTEQQAVNATGQLSSILTSHVLPLLQQFREEGCSSSPTFRYWTMYLDAIQILLNFIRSEREGNWHLHLSSLLSMVPYFFSADRTNYSRWVPVYLLDMIDLPEDVTRSFLDGQFAVRLSSAAFNGIWSDMATESTVIRDSKSDGGVVGLTRKDSALLRWMLTRTVLGQFIQSFKERTDGHNSEPAVHEQCKPSALKRDDNHAKDMIAHIENNMTHPFQLKSHPETLVNIASGVIAGKEVEKSLLSIVESGEKKMSAFLDNTLSNAGHRSFYSSITRCNTKTFAEMNKQTKVHIKGVKKQLSVSAELVFRRSLKISQTRSDITMLSVLSHPVTAIPTSLFHEDGGMRKTNKAELANILESKINPEVAAHAKSTCKENYVYIRDAMAELQSMTGNSKTFGDLAQTYMTRLVACTNRANIVIDVFDQYDYPDSIKTEERNKRLGVACGARPYQVIAGRPVPPWQKFMALSSNKAALTDFICTYLEEKVPRLPSIMSQPQRKIYLAGGYSDGEKTVCISAGGMSLEPDLSCSHEEADTRMIFHAVKSDDDFAAAGVQGSTVIKSPDTDVLVLAVHYFPKLKNTHTLYIEKGRATTDVDPHRFVPVHQICEALNPAIPRILPGMHALTGCDTVSSFFGYGKRKVWMTMDKLEKKESLPLLDVLGNCDAESAIHQARKFVVALYDPKELFKEAHGDLNVLRHRLADRDTPLSKLPPSEPSFLQHVRRASFQSRIWMLSHVNKPDIPSPDENGWQRDGNDLKLKLFDGPSASEMLDELLCSCRGRHPCTVSCSCSKNGMACTDYCLCNAGENCMNEHNVHQSNNGLDESDFV